MNNPVNRQSYPRINGTALMDNLRINGTALMKSLRINGTGFTHKWYRHIASSPMVTWLAEYPLYTPVYKTNPVSENACI